jgi:hypothetical protein
MPPVGSGQEDMPPSGVTGRPLRYAAIARTSARPVTVSLSITVVPPLGGAPYFVSTSVATDGRATSVPVGELLTVAVWTSSS